MKSQRVKYNARLLIINEDKLTQRSLFELLSRENYITEIAGSHDEAKVLLDEKHYHVIIVSPDEGELDIISDLKKRSGSSEVIVLNSYSDIDSVVQGIKKGAFDYLVRPVDDRKILDTVEKAVKDAVPDENEHISSLRICNKKDPFHGIFGDSDQMEEIFSVITRISKSSANVLLRGESGTGKRLIAQAIHDSDTNKRAKKPFIEISCGALPREIIESELFGHTKGSFTGAINDRKGRFELADKGTILLDDIDALPLDLQVKLLRVIQHKEFERVGDHKTIKVDVRIIATTNTDLEKLVEEKKFREDLFYRLNVISFESPPLRTRKEDIPVLVSHFLELYSEANQKKIKCISEDALDALVGYDWPGNIRQLENMIERAVILDLDGVVDIEDLPEQLVARDLMRSVTGDPIILGDENSLKDFLESPEKGHILNILEEVGWNKKKASKVLGVNRTTLYNKLRKYNITCAD